MKLLLEQKGSLICFSINYLLLRKMIRNHTYTPPVAPPTPRGKSLSAINFEPFSLNDIERLNPIFDASADFRSCDFTLGGMYMWINFFGYRRAFTNDGALLVNGLSEADVLTPAFSLPLGGESFDTNFMRLKEYCAHKHCSLRFSAVPEAAVERLQAFNPVQINELPQWADYLYSAEALASLTGKKYNKKRNHVNRFKMDNPGYELKALTADDIPGILKFMNLLTPDRDKPMAMYEHAQAVRLLERFTSFPMDGGVLTTPADGIVAFTIGEVRGDTLHLHIEKMRHDVNGAGEAINKFFAEYMLNMHPTLQFINRQDDGGDPGLRQAKLTYHPVDMVKKFEVIF